MKTTKIIIIEAGHLSKVAISGGDTLIQSMIPHLLDKFTFEIIIPKIAQNHWHYKKGLKFRYLPPIFLEKYPHSPFAVLLTYLWRSLYLFKYLSKIKKPCVLYSSSAEFVDWLAPFFISILKRDMKWLVRIHHLKAPPLARPGRILTNPISFLIDKIGLLCFKFADLIIVLNPNVYRQVTKTMPKRKVKILGAGVDFQRIQALAPSAKVNSYDAVFLGRIHYTKGVLDLPKIWTLVVGSIPDAKLAIIGELSIPKLAEQLKSEIETAKLQKSVAILGYLPEKDTISILKKSKVFLFTDREAGFGLAAAEAMAAGLPVVGWDIGILGTIFKKGYRKIPLNNYQKFASTVVEILTNADLQSRLSQEAKSEAKKFDWRKISKEFEKLLNNL